MALITRISRLFKADAHAVLDRLEEPDVLLAQAVRDMEESLADDERRLRTLTTEASQIHSRVDDVESLMSRADEEMDICFSEGKDDLARALVRRRLEAERLVDSLARRRVELTAEIDSLQHRIETNRSQIEVTRQKVEALSPGDMSVEKGAWCAVDIPVRDEDVEIAFLREKQRRRPA